MPPQLACKFCFNARMNPTTPANITVVGPGAIGGLLAHGLCQALGSVNVLASPRRAAQLRANGLHVQLDGQLSRSLPHVFESAAEIGPQDLVFLCLKSGVLPDMAAALRPLVGPQTLIVSAMNGLPWWYFHGAGAELAGLRLSSVDPNGAVAAALPAAQCLGCVVHLSSSVDADGVVQHGKGKRLILGDPSSGHTRSEAVAQLLERAGFVAERSSDIRLAIWLKLWGNLTMNPISALTGSTADLILDDPHTLGLVKAMMLEAQVIAQRLGFTMDMTVDERIAITRQLGAFKTSMLQDLEAGRPLEVDAIVGAVSEVGQQLGVATPFINAVLGLVRQRAARLVG
jgi:2-dehydropantoate 2-reductase